MDNQYNFQKKFDENTMRAKMMSTKDYRVMENRGVWSFKHVLVVASN
jgi:hypothetical protein